MKVGIRKPSLKKSLRARTTGRAKRSLHRAINPFYGKKGMGFIRNPRRSVKSAIYRRTTFGVSDLFKASTPKKPAKAAAAKGNASGQGDLENTEKKRGIGFYIIVGVVILLILAAITQ